MWPWEHVAVAYLAASVASRYLWGEPPSRAPALAAVLAGIGPDLVDKLLSWWLALLPSGRSLAHSLVIGGPLVLLVLLVGWRLHRSPVAIAFAVGYLTHLVGDVAYPLVVKDELRIGFLFWPLIPAPGGSVDGALPHVSELFGAFLDFLATPLGRLYLVAEGLLLALAVAVWVADGLPGLPRLRSKVPPSGES